MRHSPDPQTPTPFDPETPKAKARCSLPGNSRCQDVDLPRICVVGKQSSGKSSVMEALTGHQGYR